MHRRRFLSGALVLAAASLAGCSARAQSVPPPRVSDQRLSQGGWKLIDDIEETVFERRMVGVTVTATQHTLRYADAALRREITERSLGMVETDLNVFFATRVNFTPNIDNFPGGIGRAQIMTAVRENARDGFRQQLESAGLEDVRQSGTGSMTIDTGETAEVTRFVAGYPFEDISFPITDDHAVAIPGDAIGVDGLLASWHHGDYTLLAGGAHPAENYTRSVTQDLSDGVTVSVDVDMKLTPDAYANEIGGLIASVS